MKTYEYKGNYREITVDDELEAEGILTGTYGRIHYKRCDDGFAIIDSCFKGSGFVCWPTSEDLGFPGFINGVPVTEIRQCISVKNSGPIAIEAPELKRAYLRISKSNFENQLKEASDFAQALLMIMMRDQELAGQREKFLEISIDFCNRNQSVDYCEIQCFEKCVLRKVQSKHLKVDSPAVILEGHAYEKLERAEFSGKVYPYLDSDWGGDYYHIDYFSGIKTLNLVDGSLRGDDCWRFTNCTSLQKVHLANGIKRILPHSFENCSSLTDLYVPDTVTDIGEYAFSGCTKLRSIHLPSGITKISKGLFMGCESLTKCYLSDSIEVIEDDAFRGCTLLKKPWIPRNIKTISDTAFDNPEWGKL
jgi:hypothetical protein